MALQGSATDPLSVFGHNTNLCNRLGYTSRILGEAMCHFYTDALLSKFLTFVDISFSCYVSIHLADLLKYFIKHRITQ